MKDWQDGEDLQKAQFEVPNGRCDRRFLRKSQKLGSNPYAKSVVWPLEFTHQEQERIQLVPAIRGTLISHLAFVHCPAQICRKGLPGSDLRSDAV